MFLKKTMLFPDYPLGKRQITTVAINITDRGQNQMV